MRYTSFSLFIFLMISSFSQATLNAAVEEDRVTINTADSAIQAAAFIKSIKSGDVSTIVEAGFTEIASDVDSEGNLNDDWVTSASSGLEPKQVVSLLESCEAVRVEIDGKDHMTLWKCKGQFGWLERPDGDDPKCFVRTYYLYTSYSFDSPFIRLIHRNQWSNSCGIQQIEFAPSPQRVNK